jgi:hypothetical protein
MIWLLVGVVAFVLLIACQCGNLTLAHTMVEQNSPCAWPLVRTVAGRTTVSRGTPAVVDRWCTVGVVLASWGTRSALAVLPSALPDSVHVGTNIRVLALAISVTS